MKIENLNSTNISHLTESKINEIETFLGKEIEVVSNYKKDYKYSYCDVMPYDSNASRFNPFTRANIKKTFNHETGICSVTGRNKYERKNVTKMFQFEKVGYKLQTTKLSEGYIWGNPKEIN
ncbi:MAG: hypothetical protein IPO21_14490 [Bacteroidales bacterium]|nr:hypothetical protein [Bacteroidales bacterium]